MRFSYQKGFSLFEAMLAVAIVSTVILGFLQYQINAVQITRQSLITTLAGTLANNAVEAWRAGQLNSAQLQQTVSKFLPQGSLQLNCNVKRCDVRLLWQQADEKKSLSLIGESPL